MADTRRPVESLSLPGYGHASLPVTDPTPLGLQGTHNRTFQRASTSIHIGNTWREVQGASEWMGLVGPLDERLRAELIRYGQFAQVAYDAFDFDKYSKYCGSCRYSRHTLFEEVDLHNTGYTVTKYIYATADVHVHSLLRRSEREDAWSTKSNWIGYVAVCTDENEINRLGRRDIMIVWRGTVTGLEWAANLKFLLAPFPMTDTDKSGKKTTHNIQVETGFQSLYISTNDDSKFSKISAQDYLLKEIEDLITQYKDKGHELSITICGHSLGSAMATISAYDIADKDLNQTEVGGKKVTIPITVFSFAGPRVGNRVFKDRLHELGVRVLRVVNKGDVVPHVPGWDILEDLSSRVYTHVRGPVLELDDNQSKHLNHGKGVVWTRANLMDLLLKNVNYTAFGLHHHLEVYMHLIDGYGRYDKPPCRDLILVNKNCGFLKEDKFVPEAWWQPKHKGLQYSVAENRYYQPDRPWEDIPVPPNPETVAASKAFTRSRTLKKDS